MTRKTHRRAIATIGCACALLTGCDDDGGADEPTRPLPRVIGLTLSQAEQRLQNTPVEWTFRDDGGTVFETVRSSSGGANKALASRRVAAQDPKPGTRVDRYDIVLLKLRRR